MKNFINSLVGYGDFKTIKPDVLQKIDLLGNIKIIISGS
jgi:hypothetical protein